MALSVLAPLCGRRSAHTDKGTRKQAMHHLSLAAAHSYVGRVVVGGVAALYAMLCIVLIVNLCTPGGLRPSCGACQSMLPASPNSSGPTSLSSKCVNPSIRIYRGDRRYRPELAITSSPQNSKWWTVSRHAVSPPCCSGGLAARTYFCT